MPPGVARHLAFCSVHGVGLPCCRKRSVKPTWFSELIVGVILLDMVCLQETFHVTTLTTILRLVIILIIGLIISTTIDRGLTLADMAAVPSGVCVLPMVQNSR
jgi:hypothetical protein